MINITFLLSVFFFITFTTSIPFQKFYYPQSVDQLGFGKLARTMFRQRFFIDYNHLGTNKSNPPIIVYLGGEAPISTWLEVGENGFASFAAHHFQALVLYIEHRFYGESVPFGSIDAAMSDSEVRGCLTSEQALADFTEIIQYIKRNSSSYTTSPVIAIGGSYAGMLAAWFRLKYPHVITGALSSSAPLISPIDIPPQYQYCSIVSKDFKDISPKCFENIWKSWELIDEIGSKVEGIENLSRIFKSCSPILSPDELKMFLTDKYYFAAQYDGRFQTFTHALCHEFENAASEDEILPSIARGIAKLNAMTKGTDCSNMSMIAHQSLTMFGLLDPNSSKAWNWQVCSELVPPTGCDDTSMFVPSTFNNMTKHMEECREEYGVYPHRNWMTKYYGSQDMKRALKNFGSNILFSNGLRDPLSGAGILHGISDTITAITTEKGSHCLDLGQIKDDDPDWLRQQRKEELKILSKWINSSSIIRRPIMILLLGIGAALLIF